MTNATTAAVATRRDEQTEASMQALKQQQQQQQESIVATACAETHKQQCAEIVISTPQINEETIALTETTAMLRANCKQRKACRISSLSTFSTTSSLCLCVLSVALLCAPLTQATVSMTNFTHIDGLNTSGAQFLAPAEARLLNHRLDGAGDHAAAMAAAAAAAATSVSSRNNTSGAIKKLADKLRNAAYTIDWTGALGSKNNSATPSQFGDQPASSIFRPSFLRGLLGAGGRDQQQQQAQASQQQQQQSSANQDDDQEEEVTQTIMMPISQQEHDAKNGVVSSAKQQRGSDDDDSMQRQLAAEALKQQPAATELLDESQSSRHPGFLMHHSPAAAAVAAGLDPKAAASLQLTSTEINQLLNDREAPDMYRDRELHGDGVMIGEEQQSRLGTAASDRHFGAHYGPGAHYDGAAAPRPFPAASEGYSSGGFDHRFGMAGGAEGYGGGGGGDAHSEALAGHHGGRLMGSPNEYNEVHAGASYGGGAGGAEGFYGGGDGGRGAMPLDYAQSGMLRAGSGEYGGGGGEGGFGGSHESAGYYPGAHLLGAGGESYNPGLEKHASELYGGGGGGGGGYGQSEFAGGASHMGHTGMPIDASGLYGEQSHRLMSAGSHAGYGAGGEADEYSGARFGGHGAEMGAYGGGGGGLPYDHRGFAASHTNMVRGGEGSDASGKIVPLSPVIPVAEELGGGGPNYGGPLEGESSSKKDMYSKHPAGLKPQVHEPLNDEDTEPGEPRSTSAQHGSQANSNADDAEDSESDSSGTSGVTSMPDGYSSTTPLSVRQRTNSYADDNNTSRGGGGHSIVLNMPPPSDHKLGPAPGVEFARIGSAGYVAPNVVHNYHSRQQHSRFNKKTAMSQQSRAHQHDDYDPADNPAHAGKYIID